MKLLKKLDLMWIMTAIVILFTVAGVFVAGMQGRVHAEDGLDVGTGEIVEMSEGDDLDREDFLVEAVSYEAKYVTIYDDGEKLTVKTEARTVAEVLAKVGVNLSEGDLVEPGLESEINMNNFFINIYRARPVIVQDGKVTKFAMVAGFDAKEIAKKAGVTIYDGDEIELVPNTRFLETGVASVYEVIRNGGRTITEEVEIPFGEESVKDLNLASGKTEVRQLGEVGMKRVHYKVYYVDGQEVSRELESEEVVREPVNRIVAIGMKKSIPPEAATCADWARAAGVSEADLSIAIDLIYRESGCRVDARNASTGAYGIPQALPGSKMAAYGADWETNPVTQIKWMISYVNGRYGGWNGAANWWYSHGWY